VGHTCEVNCLKLLLGLALLIESDIRNIVEQNDNIPFSKHRLYLHLNHDFSLRKKNKNAFLSFLGQALSKQVFERHLCPLLGGPVVLHLLHYFILDHLELLGDLPLLELLLDCDLLKEDLFEGVVGEVELRQFLVDDENPLEEILQDHFYVLLILKKLRVLSLQP